MRSLFSQEWAAKHPLTTALASGLAAGIGAGGIAYARFASQSLALAVVVGLIAGFIVFRVIYQQPRRSAAEQIRVPRMRLARASFFDFVLIGIAVVLAVLALVFSTWSLAVPALIFACLGGALVALRHFLRQPSG